MGKPVLLWKGQGNMFGEVIGVVADSRERGPAADLSLTVYIPYGPASPQRVLCLTHAGIRRNSGRLFAPLSQASIPVFRFQTCGPSMK